MNWTDEEMYLVAQRGYDLAGQGRYELAGALFEGLLAVAPSHDWARRALASVQIRTGRAAAALVTLESLAASDTTARLLRIEAHLAMGSKAEAAAELAAARPGLRAREARRYAALLDATPSPRLR
jgi:thioredoxin-like negative regulator of GroEL